MLLSIETCSYNEKCYGRPWIAKITWDQSGKMVYNFGEFNGRPGGAGELLVNVEIGDVIATGQRDNRKRFGSTNELYIVEQKSGETNCRTSEGECTNANLTRTTPAAARKYYATELENRACAKSDTCTVCKISGTLKTDGVCDECAQEAEDEI